VSNTKAHDLDKKSNKNISHCEGGYQERGQNQQLKPCDKPTDRLLINSKKYTDTKTDLTLHAHVSITRTPDAAAINKEKIFI
jgi:hypothetical protein